VGRGGAGTVQQLHAFLLSTLLFYLRLSVWLWLVIVSCILFSSGSVPYLFVYGARVRMLVGSVEICVQAC
jgi:hypothetical protein